MRRSLLLFVLGAACSSTASPPRTSPPFTEVVIETAPGLSGLAADARGRLWTVAERDLRAYRYTLGTAALETFPIEGVPPGTDLEGIEELGDDQLAFGTEGQDDDSATVLFAEVRAAKAVITSSVTFTAAQIGIPMKHNHGAEGICGAGRTLFAAIEGAGIEGNRRWAPVMRVEAGALVRRYRVWLTSATGKLSALDCDLAPDGTATVWAIERHFEVSRLLSFTLPPVGTGSDDITPKIERDLAPYLGRTVNLEGIAKLPDGRIVIVNDNQYTSIEGPSRLFVFR